MNLRAQELFLAASALADGERASFLDAECAGAPELRAEIELLLSTGGKPPAAPEAPAPATWTSAIDELKAKESQPRSQLERGETIGRFVVLGLVGRGGMGEVYAAYDPELDRKVAVKVVRARVSRSSDSRGRLMREAQAIAKLSHPNVVVVYDVGTIGERVFIAMEFVEGRTVGQWLQDTKRSVREVLGVFMAAGRGLAAAHKAGLVHRDFKPDNVMIGDDEQVRVMDFGLARQVTAGAKDRRGKSSDGTTSDSSREDLAPRTPDPEDALSRSGAHLSSKLTQTGVRMGSPAYMAPEQFMGAETDARTDQFSFCVALYEALYGERPFAGQTALALQLQVLDGAIRPPPASSRVPSWIRRIVLRGLSPGAGDRFPSMEDLLAALAKDPAAQTRRWALAAGTVATMAALVGVTHRLGSTERSMCTSGGGRLAGIWEPGRPDSERKAAVQRAFRSSGRSYAERAYEGAAQLLDQYATRWTSMYTEACEATHVRGEQSAEVLDLRMACLRERLVNLRALSDVFATADGKVVENAVTAAAALPPLDRCGDVALLRAVIQPPDDPKTRKQVDDLKDELAQLIALRDSGQCARAIPKADSLIARARAVGYEPLLADTLYAAAQVGSNCGGAAEILQRLRDAHTAATASHNDEVAAQAASLIPSFAINRFGEIPVAREWLVVARGDVARIKRETVADAMLAQAEGMLALTDKAYDRAIVAADRSIDITRRLLGPDDPLTIQWEVNKGDMQATAGRLEDALKTDVRAREHLERILGPEHPRVGYAWHNEGEHFNLMGRYRESEVAYQRAADLFRQNGADVDVLAWALNGLGRARLGQDRPDAALAPLEEALTIRTRQHAPAPQTGETRFLLARALESRPAERRRALELASNAHSDLAGDPKAIAEIDAWLDRARPKHAGR
jgi:tetratricopeptide (TPR) repeat protein/predicted Ser/Thr protein kinase